MEPTYGKWKWYWKENEYYEADCGVYVEEVCGQAVSVCRAPRFEKKERWEANARLIAAAPDLMEACKWALEAQGWDRNDQNETRWTTLYARLKMVVAVAKAEGKEP